MRIPQEANDILKVMECFPLSLLERDEWFRNSVFESMESKGVQCGNRGQYIGSEFSVVRATFNDSPTLWGADFLPFAEKAVGEQFAEERPHTHAGIEVAAASDLASSASIVAEVGFIERHRHEFRKGQWTVSVDAFLQYSTQRRSCGGGPIGIFVSALCR